MKRTDLPNYRGTRKRTSSMYVGGSIKYYDKNSWGLDKRLLPSLEDLDLNQDFSPYELDRIADAILWRQIDEGYPASSDPPILMFEHLDARRKKEIYVASGIPDETVTSLLSPDGQTIYWRAHPRGRKIHSDEQRKRGAGYFA